MSPNSVYSFISTKATWHMRRQGLPSPQSTVLVPGDQHNNSPCHGSTDLGRPAAKSMVISFKLCLPSATSQCPKTPAKDDVGGLLFDSEGLGLICKGLYQNDLFTRVDGCTFAFWKSGGQRNRERHGRSTTPLRCSRFGTVRKLITRPPNYHSISIPSVDPKFIKLVDN